MAQWHAIDLTDFDLAPAARSAHAVATRFADVARDATYITIGLGVLAFSKAQTQRREFERSLRN